MGIASQQDLINKPLEESKWTFRTLFQLGGVTKILQTAFTNVFEVLLGFCVFIIGVSELVRGGASLEFYMLALVLFAAVMFGQQSINFNKNHDS